MRDCTRGAWRGVGKTRTSVGRSSSHTTDGAKSQRAMTTKGMPTADSTGSLSLAQLPPQISLTSSMLASITRLPPDPLIAYTIFEPSDTLDPSLHLSTIESARRSLVSDSRSLLKCLLFTVKILPRFPVLYVFAISSSDQRSPPHDALLDLKFDGLVCMFISLHPVRFPTRLIKPTLTPRPSNSQSPDQFCFFTQGIVPMQHRLLGYR